MQIKDMFTKEIDRDLQGVIIVGQDENENIKQELEEYVVTNELQKRFADFFSAYKKGIIGTTTKTGVWISGFFGSGKSHLLKILYYLLINKEVSGKKALDYFIDDHKISDAMVLADMKLAADTPTDAVLFNIDSKSDSNGKQDKDAIVNVFMKVFNEMQGYCGAIPVLADLERKLSEAGRYEEFKQKFEVHYGNSWIESRSDFDYVQDDVVTVLSEMGFMSEAAGRNWCEKAILPQNISIEDFAKRVNKYIEDKGNNHHVVFLVDEVGQYIGDDRKQMLELQTIREDLGIKCNGKAWVIVTSQQDIDSVVSVKGNDFSKIQGRFDTRLSLTSANVDAVIKKRILEKKETPAQMLRLLYGQKKTIISNKIVFTDIIERKLYSNEDDFSNVYPFIPYQFNLLASVLTAVRTHGASGKHLSEGERSMLAMFKEAAADHKDEMEGTLIPFYAFYKPMESFLDHSHRSVIIKAYDNNYINPEHKKNDVFAINVLKTLFLIKYVKDFTANVENITTLMINDIDSDRVALRSGVEESLRILMNQMLIQKNGEVYVFLTDEEQEINREIEGEVIDDAEVINKVSVTIFDDIFKEPKYICPKFGGRYSFNFNKIVDDRAHIANQSYDIGVHILTPASDIQDELTLRIKSGQGKEVLVVLPPDDHAFMDEIQTYLKIEKYLRRNTSSSLVKFGAIKDAKTREYRDRVNNAKLFLLEALKNADIYVNGDKAEIKIKDVNSRINEAIGKLVETVYNKLPYITAPMNEDSIRKLFESDNQMSMKIDDSQEANAHALDDMLSYIAGNTNMHMKTSMKSIRDRFMRAPYGFVEDDVFWLVAKLFRRGDLVFTINGVQVSLLNKSKEEIISFIIRKQFAEKLLVEQRIRISDREKKTCHDVMKELFNTSSTNDDEDAVMQTFIRYSGNLLDEIGKIEVRYETASYPGRSVIDEGRKLLVAVIRVQSTAEFYKFIQSKQDDFINFGTYYEPIKEFFKGEQKEIFDRALRLMQIYDDSKTYIVDAELEDTVRSIKEIISEQEPYGDIPKLPELLDNFTKKYGAILDEQEAPVKDSVKSSYERVIEVLNTKSYVMEKQGNYSALFDEIKYGVEHCNNISVLRSYADKADALKIRLLNEMDKKDAEIVSLQEAEELRRCKEQASQTGIEQPVIQPKSKIRKIKNMQIKTLTHTSSWRLESEADIDKCVDSLKKELAKQLDKDTIINIEF